MGPKDIFFGPKSSNRKLSLHFKKIVHWAVHLMSTNTSSNLTIKILIGMFMGVFLGSLINYFQLSGEFIETYLLNGLIDIGGRVFLSSLKLLVVPMVFISLVAGAGSLDDIKKLGRLGSKTFGLYVATTALAIALALFVSEIFDPGQGFIIQGSTSFQAEEAPSLVDVIVNIFPSNPVEAMVKAEMLQIIVFAILFGVGISLAGESGKRILGTFNDLNEIIMKMVLILIELAPYGVFCLLTKVFSSQGLGAIIPMAKYFFIVLFCLILHVVVVYSLLLKVMGKLSPVKFFKKYYEVMLFAFSTSSSNATLPINMEVTEKKLGVHNSVASFTIPLGATVNMDGTAIMQGVATVFVAQVYGVELGFQGYLMTILTATLASIGTAGVPGVGLVMLAMVFKQVGLPVEGIGLIIGVDRLLDMTRTAVNVCGDAIVSCIVAKSEGQFDETVFNS
jgi:Na+/H+-dicarboxylate symporter